MKKWTHILILLVLNIISLNILAQGGPYNNPPIEVTNPGDYNSFGSPLVGSLRWAITKANNNTTNPGADHIVFNLPTNNLNIQIKSLYGNLPMITQEVYIDGTTQPGYSRLDKNTMVTISGTGHLDGCFLFYLSSSDLAGSRVEGLYIYEFNGGGIILTSVNNPSHDADGFQIIDNIINRTIPYAYIPGSILSAKTALSMFIGDDHVIQGNIFGTDNSLRQDYRIDQPIFMTPKRGSILNAQIGGTNANERNIMMFDGHGVILLSNVFQCRYNLISRNVLIGPHTGINSFGNYGITIRLGSPTNDNKTSPVITSFASNGDVDGTSDAGDIIEIFGSTGSQNANEYLTTVTANGSGVWSTNLGQIPWPYITATATDGQDNTSELSIAEPNTFCPTVDFTCYGEEDKGTNPEPALCEVCSNEEVSFSIVTEDDLSYYTLSWDFDGDENIDDVTQNPIYVYNTPGTYTVTLILTGPEGCEREVSHQIVVDSCCINCIGSFAPYSGERYVLSAWVKEDQPMVAGSNVPQQVQTYTVPEIQLEFPSVTLGGYKAKGKIIDGWQKIEEVFTIPANAEYITIVLNNSGSNPVYFDDIRFYPFKSSLKTYVYDPVTLRLAAELDENNYATFYQYDEEGKLIRVKKETERGVETIQESREASYKQAKSMDNRLKGNSTND